MDRRGFLGALAALPIVAKLNLVKEKEMVDIAPNLPLYDTIVPGSSELISMNKTICVGSGTIPMCSG